MSGQRGIGRIEVDVVTVLPGETLTVWLDRAPGGMRSSNDPARIQVELRVLPDGTPQVFCSKLAALPFSAWACDAAGYTEAVRDGDA